MGARLNHETKFRIVNIVCTHQHIRSIKRTYLKSHTRHHLFSNKSSVPTSVVYIALFKISFVCSSDRRGGCFNSNHTCRNTESSSTAALHRSHDVSGSWKNTCLSATLPMDLSMPSSTCHLTVGNFITLE